MDAIEEGKTYFAHRIYNHALFENLGFIVKYYDFLLTEDRTTDNIIIAETSVATYSLMINSGIPITPYDISMEKDNELVRLAKYLDNLTGSNSIQQVISETLKAEIPFGAS